MCPAGAAALAAAAGLEFIDQGEDGAADLVVAAQHQVGQDGCLAVGLAAPGGHQQCDPVEDVGAGAV